ncbi:glycosyltransferase [Candidatus Collierbacteria bacterium]|nr:glycosyltransferase [Candidatus Collierbacteria bacterium]
MEKTVSAIVCAYNEEKTVKPILEVLLSHPKIDEVIAVNDGSTDSTNKIINSVKNKKLVTVRHKNNFGKGAAIANAVKTATGNILLFVDADTHSFHQSHVDMLLSPIFIDPKCMVIGLRDGEKLLDKTLNAILKSIGGERVIMKKYVIPLLPRIKNSGYGVETILNLATVRHNRRIYYVPLPQLFHPLKTANKTLAEALKEYWREQNQVIAQLLDYDNYELPSFQELLGKLRKLA